jgi:autotransporter-associated beta strand protein
VGILTLSASNTYSGGTTVSAGTLQVGNSNAIPSGWGKGDVIVNGTLDLHGNNLSINGLSDNGTGAGIVTSLGGAAILSVGYANASSTFSGVIQDGSGAVGLAKVYSGTLILTGSNTYTGGTTISAGTLQVGTGGRWVPVG